MFVFIIVVRVSWSLNGFYKSAVIPKSVFFLAEKLYKIDIDHSMHTITINDTNEDVAFPPARYLFRQYNTITQ